MPDFNNKENEFTNNNPIDKTVKRPDRLVDHDGPTLQRGKSPALRSETIPAGEVVADRFVLIEFLAEGGMGKVYKAKQLSTGRIVVLKMLPESAIRFEDRQRFHREAKIASALSHPNAVSIFDFGETANGQLFIAMEYVEGIDLAALIKKEGTLEMNTLLDIGIQICDALVEAHSRGIVHRDLKPANIMLTENKSKTNIVKVLDFGIAKVDDENQSMTKTGEIFGSPLYMSPEQCKGLKVTASSDIYSLGCILYEACVGSPPHQGPNAMATIFKHSNEEARRPSKVRPDLKIPEEFDALILKCLEKDLHARYRSTEELRRELSIFLEREAQISRPAQRISLPRWNGRIVLVSLVVIATVCGSYYMVAEIKTREQKQQAEILAKQDRERMEPIQTERLVEANKAYGSRDYATAAKLYEQVYEQANKDHDKTKILEIGTKYAISLELKKPEERAKALEPLRVLAQLQHDGADKEALADTLGHLSEYYYELKLHVQGDEYAREDLKVERQISNDRWQVGQKMYDLARSLSSQGEGQRANAHDMFRQAENWLKEPNHKNTSDHKRVQALVTSGIADLAKLEGDGKKSVEYRRMSVKMFKERLKNYASSEAATLARTEEALGNIEEARQAWLEAINCAPDADKPEEQKERVKKNYEQFEKDHPTQK